MNEMRNGKKQISDDPTDIWTKLTVRNEFEKFCYIMQKKRTNPTDSTCSLLAYATTSTYFKLVSFLLLQLSFIGIEIKINSIRNQIKSGCKKKYSTYNSINCKCICTKENSKWRYYYQRSKKEEKNNKNPTPSDTQALRAPKKRFSCASPSFLFREILRAICNYFSFRR